MNEEVERLRALVRVTELDCEAKLDAARAEVEALSRQRDRDYEIAIEERDSALDDLITARAEVERLSLAEAEAQLQASRNLQRVCELETEVERLRGALRNVRALAARALRKGFSEGDAEHLLRFCREVGVEAQILRDGRAALGEEKK